MTEADLHPTRFRPGRGGGRGAAVYEQRGPIGGRARDTGGANRRAEGVGRRVEGVDGGVCAKEPAVRWAGAERSESRFSRGGTGPPVLPTQRCPR